MKSIPLEQPGTRDGRLTFARYAFMPNALGYCGGPEDRELLEYAVEDTADDDAVATSDEPAADDDADEAADATAESDTDAGDDAEENGPDAVARQAVDAIRSGLVGGSGVDLDSVGVGYRPIPRDGLPIIGTVPQINGLYVAVMHAGVTLAPLVGRLAAQELLDGAEAAALATCRPTRFAA